MYFVYWNTTDLVTEPKSAKVTTAILQDLVISRLRDGVV